MATDWVNAGTTALVLVGLFFLAYSAIRKQGLRDTWEEITGKTKEKLEDAKETAFKNG